LSWLSFARRRGEVQPGGERPGLGYNWGDRKPSFLELIVVEQSERKQAFTSA